MVDLGLVVFALALAPLVFMSVGWISQQEDTPKKTLQAMGLLVVLGLALGLLSPIVGAAAGFGVGIAITLNMPDFEGQLMRRLLAVGFAVAYMYLMLRLIPPAGVLAGGVLPGPMVGLADEYGAWRFARNQTTEDRG